MSFFSTSNRKSLPGANVPVISMPNVFVVPPEEDETPPWCFFDAENPSFYGEPEYQEIHEDDVFAFNPDMDTPILSRNTQGSQQFMSRSNFQTVSVVDALDDPHERDADGDMDSDSEYDDDLGQEQIEYEHERSGSLTGEESGNDSDVIEVVRVNRRRPVSDDNDTESRSVRTVSELKRSVTLKSRASKVFKSLRGSMRVSSHPRVQNAFPPELQTREEHQDVNSDNLSRSKTPNLSRRTSRMFSQFFSAPSLKSKRSSASFNNQNPLQSQSDSPLSEPPMSPISPRTESFAQVPSRRSSFSRSILQDERRLGATSPTFTINSARSKTSIFSISKIQKLFSFSAPTQFAPGKSSTSSNESDNRSSSTLHSTQYTPPSAISSASTASSSPQTPLSSDETTSEPLVLNIESGNLPAFDHFDSIFDTNSAGLNLGLGLSLDTPLTSNGPEPILRRTSFGSIRSLMRSGMKGKKPLMPPEIEEGDDELEMRLDSFHFDELSFDMDRFSAK